MTAVRRSAVPFIVRCALAIATAFVAIHTAIVPALAQIAAPEPIDTPIRAEWREPFAAFLHELGARNPDKMIEKAFGFQIGLRNETIAVRVEDETTCHDDQCFTVIGRVTGKRFVADAMFAAGKRFTRSDHAVPVLGWQTFPAWFVGNTMTVTVYELERGWLVVPGLTPKDQTGSPGKN